MGNSKRFVTENICKQLKTQWLSASVGGQQEYMYYSIQFSSTSFTKVYNKTFTENMQQFKLTVQSDSEDL